MFNFFKKTPQANRQPDQVWFHTAAKYLGISKLMQEIAQDKANTTLVIYYFPQTLFELQTALNTLGINLQTIENQSDWQKKTITSSILAMPAELLKEYWFEMGLSTLHPDFQNLHFIFAEHYPLYSIDNHYVTKIGGFSKNIPITFFCALDEPLLKIFGSERIQSMMLKMGMTEDEVITHSMITTSISNAQKKIDKAVKMDIKANSSKEWFDKNYDTK